MASIGKDRNQRKRLLFVAEDGSRKTIRLGKASMKQAGAFKVKLESLITGRLTGNIDDETARWVADLPDDAHAKLAAVGLVKPRASLRLGEFLERYIKDRTDIKPGTATVLGHTKRNLVAFFGPDKPLREINQGDADQWRLYLVGQGLSVSTTGRRCRIAKQFFRAAVRRKLALENPFTDLAASDGANKSREYFLSCQDAQKVLEACPDSQWRLIFALSRYGGLRCPSEHLTLKWQDIDWDRGRILVHSPKTEHHVGGESRLVPLFPELLPLLQQAFDEAEPGTQYVITRYRSSAVNLRTSFQKIIRKAGLKAWPKLFQNLRSTRETELCERWPEHVVCAWIGNSRAVARKHYLQVTEEHFEQAAQNPAHSGGAAQNAAQYPAGTGGNTQDVTPQEDPENGDLLVSTGASDTIQNDPLGRGGFEPPKA